VSDNFPCLQSALGDGGSNSGAKYAVVIVKFKRELDHWFQDVRSLENGIKTFLKPFVIDIESVAIDVQMEFIKLHNDLDL